MSFNKFKKYLPDAVSKKQLKKIGKIAGLVLAAACIIVFFEIYIPVNPFSRTTITYEVKKGLGDDEIAKDLKKINLIRSEFFFRFYVVSSFRHSSLQAGKYNLSARMSSYDIVKKLSNGDTIKNMATILEGWDKKDISDYLEEKGFCKKEEFLSLSKNDYSGEFEFLKDKPKNADLEGYLFPDTYEFAEGETCQNVLEIMLSNFDKKLMPELRGEIKKKDKTIFGIVTMASLIEKEVGPMADKKIVSGILWKRISIGMPLQLDCTINYITGKSDPAARIKDTQIDSPYNTYKYYGLPKGPISNPGINSIIAAIYPTKTDYLYYLSDGITHYSATFEEHQAKKALYLQ